jgi:hypothetical protein
MPPLPSMDVSEIMLVEVADYQPDCPWKMFDNDDDHQPRGNLNRVRYGNNDSDSNGFEGVQWKKEKQQTNLIGKVNVVNG